MIYKGSGGLKAYVGNTGVDKMYIGNTLVYSSIPLPYDAQVEYLESDGTQYIETGIVPGADTGISIEIERLNDNDAFIVGLKNDSGNTRWCIGASSGSNIYHGYGSFYRGNIKPANARASLNYLNDGTFTVENLLNSANKYSRNIVALPFTPTYNIRLFGSAGVVGAFSQWTGRMKSVKISQGSAVIMDCIPVRIGQVGYMYDKVSGEFFGNDGTGDFILGADV